ncbi:hypothetical protein GIB67_002066 [Kingdonia uniflora]|uniref:Uncharacterized protein n=1 Tax=Kingdonia uniflora TaxID=39325 RepID=A0A7J7KWB1_9MAGN|nr:hypothetical protein GIB67_002066 [Kingdonia uniflora]
MPRGSSTHEATYLLLYLYINVMRPSCFSVLFLGKTLENPRIAIRDNLMLPQS